MIQSQTACQSRICGIVTSEELKMHPQTLRNPVCMNKFKVTFIIKIIIVTATTNKHYQSLKSVFRF